MNEILNKIKSMAFIDWVLAAFFVPTGLLFGTMVGGWLMGANDRGSEAGYRVISNGSVFQAQKRLYPFWVSTHNKEFYYGTYEAARAEVCFQLDKVRADRHAEKNKPRGPWLNLSDPKIADRFKTRLTTIEQCLKCGETEVFTNIRTIYMTNVTWYIDSSGGVSVENETRPRKN